MTQVAHELESDAAVALRVAARGGDPGAEAELCRRFARRPPHAVQRDLFTQPSASVAPLTDGDILGPSEGMRQGMPDYFAAGAKMAETLARLAAFEPSTLACMHGSSYRGGGAALLGELSKALLTPAR